jgi:hypothetical protein
MAIGNILERILQKSKKKNITPKLIEYITTRKTTFDYRLKGLLTNMEQVKTLCGFEVCAFVFGLGDTKHSIWPSIMI